MKNEPACLWNWCLLLVCILRWSPRFLALWLPRGSSPWWWSWTSSWQPSGFTLGHFWIRRAFYNCYLFVRFSPWVQVILYFYPVHFVIEPRSLLLILCKALCLPFTFNVMTNPCVYKFTTQVLQKWTSTNQPLQKMLWCKCLKTPEQLSFCAFSLSFLVIFWSFGSKIVEFLIKMYWAFSKNLYLH